MTAPVPQLEAMQALELALRQNHKTQNIINNTMKRLTKDFDSESREVINALKASPTVSWQTRPPAIGSASQPQSPKTPCGLSSPAS